MTNAAVGYLLGGHMTLVLGTKHGWRALGKPRTITSAEQNIIKTIDGKPAFKIYQEYFGEKATFLKERNLGQLSILYPLGMYLEEENEYLLRSVVNILDDGSLVCQDAVPEKTEVHVMIGNREWCKQAAQEAAEEVKRNLFGQTPDLVIIFESLARHKLLGRSAFEEIAAIKKVLGESTPMIGMYSHGELAPFQSLANIRKTYLQNESIIILAISSTPRGI